MVSDKLKGNTVACMIWRLIYGEHVCFYFELSISWRLDGSTQFKFRQEHEELEDVEESIHMETWYWNGLEAKVLLISRYCEILELQNALEMTLEQNLKYM